MSAQRGRASTAREAIEPRAEIRLDSVRPTPLKQQVFQALRRLIDEGVLQPGDQLPTERQLSEQLGVSRGTVREAVQFLDALGLVESRHGHGTFVRSHHAIGDLRGEWRQWTAHNREQVHELLELRRGLESFAAELAVARGPSTDAIDRMENAVDAMKDASDAGDIPALVQADVAFHSALCEASGNKALSTVAEEIVNASLRERAMTWDIPGRPQRSLHEHRAILDAIRKQDGEAAQALIVEHLASVEHDVNEAIADETYPKTG